MGKLKSVVELLATVEKLLHRRRLPFAKLKTKAAAGNGRSEDAIAPEPASTRYPQPWTTAYWEKPAVACFADTRMQFPRSGAPTNVVAKGVTRRQVQRRVAKRVPTAPAGLD